LPQPLNKFVGYGVFSGKQNYFFTVTVCGVYRLCQNHTRQKSMNRNCGFFSSLCHIGKTSLDFRRKQKARYLGIAP
jgi:hypothetical protein